MVSFEVHEASWRIVAERVRGFLFVDYVRMIRGRKDVDWSKHLEPEDLEIVASRVDPDAWYPMATFERLGLAILREIAHGSQDGVRMWGRFQVDAVRKVFPSLVAEGDPRDTLMRFRVLAGSFFDEGTLEVVSVDDDHAVVAIAYGMSPPAEETASTQALGFFERLVELSGGKNVAARFTEKAWEGRPRSVLDVYWDLA
jgi:hypothetical protein